MLAPILTQQDSGESWSAIGRYSRCTVGDFYQNFTAKSPQIVEKFKGTDMKRQIDTLKHGLRQAWRIN